MGDLLGHLERKAIGVVQEKGDVTGQRRTLGQGFELFVEDRLTLAKRVPEANLLTIDDVSDECVVGGKIRVVGPHDLDDCVDHAPHHCGFDAKDVRMAHRPTQDAAEHVPARFVGRKHAVAHQHRGRSCMIGKNPQRHELLERGCRRIDTGQFSSRPLQREEFVGVPDRIHTLQHRHRALEAHPGIDGRFGKGHFRAVGLLVELHEDEVPNLDESILVAVFGATVVTELGALVPEDLRTWPTRTDVAHLPVVVLVEALNALGRNADMVFPDLGSLVVAEMDGDPQSVLVEPEDIGDEFPCPRTRLMLEVVTETEVPHHFEEREMPFRAADLVEVVVLATGSHTLLNGDGALVVGGLLAGEIGLERHHPRHGEQQRRIVRNQRRRRLMVVLAFDEEVGERLAYLVGLHAGLSLPARHSVAGAKSPAGLRTAPTGKSSGRTGVHGLVGCELRQQIGVFPTNGRHALLGGIAEIDRQVARSCGGLHTGIGNLTTTIADLGNHLIGRDLLDGPFDPTLDVPAGTDPEGVAHRRVERSLHLPYLR